MKGASPQLALVAVLALALAAFQAPPILALGLGTLLSCGVGAPSWAGSASRRLLGLSIIALGCGLDLGSVWASMQEGVLVACLTIGGTFAIGSLLARPLGVAQSPALLITAGTAICGGSAIAAVAPALRARSEETAAALGVVFALNGLALILLPWLGSALGLDAQDFGTWCALAIHDTSAVVGAAATHSDEALDIATTQKLARALWIVPIAALLAWRTRGGNTASADARPGPAQIPRFLIWFVVASGLVTLLPSLQPIGQSVASAARPGMILALFFAGLSLSPSAFRRISGGTLKLGLVLWIALGLGSLTFVLAR